MTDTQQLLDRAPAALAETPWEVVVWDDPVNLMSYVSFVFRSHFGMSTEQAEERMLAVHHEGSAVVARAGREAAEMHVQAMHGFGLWATVRSGDAGAGA
ncbi:ATP-dependent Clp protease adapter ClpS [Mycetocola sp. JXN-3]|uniref:ATP-dependent Clp protease adapter ClpS n=1 Tax=Mycetocola sp. JXN-3 TaxID=2116510 RepID=UPI00165CF00E|nr:ATP-dependent Clp protease adapter ClpS [Mycetocola sp. JXN-3]